MKKKARKFFIFLFFLIPLLYFTFTVMFFSPFEAAFGSIEYIIPRDVDIYLSKVDLTDDFAGFPVPGFYLDLKVNHEWRAFCDSQLFKELVGERPLDEVIVGIQELIGDLPIDPIEDVVGRQVAFSGSFDRDGSPTSYLVFFRASNRIKLFYELLTFDFVRGMANDPLLAESTVEFDSRGFIALVLSDGRTFFLKRCADLIIVGNDEKLMEDVAGLVSLGKDAIDLSLGGRHAYREKIDKVIHEGEDIVDFRVDLSRYFDQVNFDDAWKGNKIDFSVMTAMKIFNPEFFTDLTGTLNVDETIRIDARSEFHKQAVDDAETGFFDQESMNLGESMEELAAMLPPDVFVAGCARLHMQKFLEVLEKGLASDLRTLISDLVREGSRHNPNWKLSGSWEFIEYFHRTFGSRLFFALRSRTKDKPIEPFEQPMPIIAVILEIEDMAGVDLLQEVIINLQDNKRQNFDVSKLSRDWYGCDIKIIDPKGLEDLETITYTTMGREYFVLATSLDFMQDIVRSWARPEPRQELVGTALYQRAAKSFPKYGNFSLFVDMEGMSNAFHDYSVYWGHLQIEQTLEEKQQERARVKARLARSAGRGKPTEGEKFEELVDEEMGRLLQQRIDREVPKHSAAFRQRCAWLNMLRCIALSINVNNHDVDLTLQVETTLQRGGGR
jgi:hypothetical protein